jgi:hypothetical protein
MLSSVFPDVGDARNVIRLQAMVGCLSQSALLPLRLRHPQGQEPDAPTVRKLSLICLKAALFSSYFVAGAQARIV